MQHLCRDTSSKNLSTGVLVGAPRVQWLCRMRLNIMDLPKWESVSICTSDRHGDQFSTGLHGFPDRRFNVVWDNSRMLVQMGRSMQTTGCGQRVSPMLWWIHQTCPEQRHSFESCGSLCTLAIGKNRTSWWYPPTHVRAIWCGSNYIHQWWVSESPPTVLQCKELSGPVQRIHPRNLSTWEESMPTWKRVRRRAKSITFSLWIRHSWGTSL